MSNNDDSSLKWFVLGGIVTVGVSIGLGLYYKNKNKHEYVPPQEEKLHTIVTVATPPPTPPPTPTPSATSSPVVKTVTAHLEPPRISEKVISPRRKKISMIKMKLDLFMEQKKVKIMKTQMDLDEIKALVDSLAKSQNLTELDLNETNMSTDGLNSLSRILSGKNLKRLSLASNSITDIQELAFALQSNTTLTTLELARNEINNKESLHCLSESLEENSTLKKLDLNSNLIPSSCASCFYDILTLNHSLEEISLAFNSFGEAGSIEIGKGLASNKSVTKLDLSFNQIATNGAIAIFEAMSTNTSLQFLNLSGNSIESSICDSLINSLSLNFTLKELDLSSNSLQDKGFISLFEAINSSSISVLKVVNNSITDASMQEIAEILKINKILRHLDLSNNVIGDTGVMVMIDSLVGNRSLEEIYLLGNKVSFVGLEHIANVIVKGNKLGDFMIDLRENCVDSNLTSQNIQIAVNRGVIYVS